MQASNTNNEFNGPEKILMINISPAFWNTWWFRIVAAIFVLGIFYLLYVTVPNKDSNCNWKNQKKKSNALSEK